MEFGYATSVDDIFDAPAKREDWTEDDVEEGRPLLRVGSWSKDAPRSILTFSSQLIAKSPNHQTKKSTNVPHAVH